MTKSFMQRVAGCFFAGFIALSCAAATATLTLISTAADTEIAYADGWQKSGNTWRYQTSSGYATGWKKIGSKWYHFDNSGRMQIGWYEDWYKRYYLGDDGAMRTGWVQIPYQTIQNGEFVYVPTWFNFDSSGAARTGWYKDGSKWYFFGWDGAMLTGVTYLMSDFVVTSIQDDGVHYITGTGLVWTIPEATRKDVTIYYFDKSGAMKTGWVRHDGSWLYCGSDGAVKTGWFKVGPHWYYSNSSGVMQSNKWIGNYYVTSSGAMATNTWIGKYHVNASGLWDKTA